MFESLRLIPMSEIETFVVPSSAYVSDRQKRAACRTLTIRTRCRECGKMFERTRQWAYKLNDKNKQIFFCSYRCIQKAKRKAENTTRAQKIKRELAGEWEVQDDRN